MQTTRKWRLGITLALAPTTLWACHGTPAGPLPTPAFRLDPASAPAATGAQDATAPAAGSALAGTRTVPGAPAPAARAPGAALAAPPALSLAITPVETSGGGSSGGGASGGSAVAPAAAASTTGSVTIDVGQALRTALPARRRLLATTADIDHVVVILRMPNQADRMQVVTQAQVLAGTTAVTFSGLPAGTATLVVTAFDGVGTALGTGTQAAAVVVGQTTAMALDVAIDPGVVANAAGGGAVDVALTFSNGTATGPVDTCPVPAGKIVASWPMPTWGLFADGIGKLHSFYWEGEPIGVPGTHGAAGIYHASATDGAPGEATIIGVWAHASGFGRLAARAGGLAYSPGTSTLWHPGSGFDPSAGVPIDPSVLPTGGSQPCTVIDAAGNAVFPTVAPVPDPIDPAVIQQAHRVAKNSTGGAWSLTTMAAYRTIAYDNSGNLWADWTDDGVIPTPDKASLRKYAPDESLIATLALPIIPLKLRPDPTGAMWVMGSASPSPLTGDTLIKLAPDGSVLASITGPVTDFCLDGNSSLWIATGTTVDKRTSDGTMIGQTAFPACSITYGGGMVFAGNAKNFLDSNQTNEVVKIAP